MALLQSKIPTAMTEATTPRSSPSPSPSRENDTPSPLMSSRSGKQLSLFFAGATFFALSAAITRRSVHRRKMATFPSFYHPSNMPPTTPINGAMEAFEALNVATVNVASFAMMMTGGMLWAFDISSMEDLRRTVRGGMGADGGGRNEKAVVEEEFEEWLATVLERKRGRDEERKGEKGLGGGEEGKNDGQTNERGRPR